MAGGESGGNFLTVRPPRRKGTKKNFVPLYLGGCFYFVFSCKIVME
jgi:hypothetical protein